MLPATVRRGGAGPPGRAGPSSAIDALAALAIAGGELDLANVSALTGMAGDAAFALLDNALEAGILVVALALAMGSGTSSFARRSLTSCPRHRRVRMHREAAQRLAIGWRFTGAGRRALAAGRRPDEAAELAASAARGHRGLARLPTRWRRSSGCWPLARRTTRHCACTRRGPRRARRPGARPTPTRPRPRRSASPAPRSCAPARRWPS